MNRRIVKIISFVLIFACMFSSGVFAKDNDPSFFSKITYDAYPEVFSSAYPAGVRGLTKEELEKNKQEVYDYILSIGFNSAVACGIMANIECESSFNPNVWGDNGTSYGICQWHNSRYEDLKSYCLEKGYDYTTVSGQLRYLKAEMEGRLYNGITICNYLKNNVTNDPDGAWEAGRYWCYNYERPKDKEESSPKRGDKAKNEYWPIYGKATVKVVTVTFVSDGKAVSVKSLNEGGTVTFETLSKSNYSFLGWSEDPNAKTAEYSGGKTYIINEDVTLYAVWEAAYPVAYRVRFDPAGGEVDTLSKIVISGSEYGDLPVPVKQGGYFAGWYTDDGVKITEKSTVERRTEHTLYARWSDTPVSNLIKNVKVPDSIRMRYKGKTVITPEIEKNDGVQCRISFTSSDPKIVSVDDDGNLVALKRGDAKITCTVTDQYGACASAETEVTVKYSLIQCIIILLLFGWIWY